jgi:hypothetical protein
VTAQTDLSREAENLLRFLHNFRNRLDYVTFPRPVRVCVRIACSVNHNACLSCVRLCVCVRVCVCVCACVSVCVCVRA